MQLAFLHCKLCQYVYTVCVRNVAICTIFPNVICVSYIDINLQRKGTYIYIYIIYVIYVNSKIRKYGQSVQKSARLQKLMSFRYRCKKDWIKPIITAFEFSCFTLKGQCHKIFESWFFFIKLLFLVLLEIPHGKI